MTSLNEKHSLLAVLQFLRKKNLKEAEEALRKEAGLDSVLSQVNSDSLNEPDLSNVLSEYESEADPLRYEEYYEGLLNFVEKSLDVHKHELSLVLYPVFVHLYLECVYKGYINEAEKFYDKFSKYQESYRFEDLQILRLLKKKEHMISNNEYLNMFRSNKYVIRMARESFNVLKKYLQVKNMDVLLNLIQQHFHLDVFDGRPRNQKAIDATAGYFTGEAPPDANKAKVFFGLIHDPELMAALADDGDSEDEAAVVDKDKEKHKKKKARRDEGKKRHTADPNAPKSDRIPFPKMKDSEKRFNLMMYKDISKRLHVGPNKIPSICFYTFLNAQDNLNCVEISEDSSLIAAGFDDSSIKVSTLNPKKLRTLKTVNELAKIDKEADDVLERVMNEKSAAESRQLYGHSGPVFGVSFNHDKSFLLSSSEDGSVRLWSMHTFTNLVSWKGHIYPVWDVQFSPRGYYFVSGSYDRTARLWCTESSQSLRIFAGHLSDVNVIDFHPNSNYVATGSADRTVRIWDLQTGTSVRLFTGHKAGVLSVKFSPDGRHLVSSGVDKRIILWDIAEAAPLAEFTGHSSTVNSLCFSREGHMLASAGMDNCVKLWDVKGVYPAEEDDHAESNLSKNFNNCELASFVTKSSPIHHLHFTRKNLLLGCGPFMGSS
ncbi:transcription initiation factor TFIID subunit 5 isoform X1 [Hydra vulgaris]|nr:transcription initiation factor TFIID subunit 5 [Hydra vulgaris]XP_047138088.1 transcription initiation factor TFIID subunit 5 [Hydra vulgaris]